MSGDDAVLEAGSPLDLRLPDDELRRRHRRIRSFVREQVERRQVDRAVVGLSGGIDSTVVATVAVDALGPDAVSGRVMPSDTTPDGDVDDAERVADGLGIEYDVVEITPIVEQFFDAHPEPADDRVTVGKLHARVRAVLSYLVANDVGAVVLGTGNRTELALGYFTKYGDGAVDCHPIGNLYKQQVRQLARHLEVPEDLVTKTPSARLWEGQTDEGEIGVGYDTVDSILALTVHGPVPSPAAADRLEVAPRAIETVRRMHADSAHKRSPPPTP